MIDISQDIIEQFIDKKILVTGGTGLIGRQVLEILQKIGTEVTSVSLDNVRPINGVKYITADLSEIQTCMEISRNKDYVFHLAGIKGSVEVTKSRPASFFVNLLMMNTNILEACRKNGVKKVVYTSSIGAYSSAEIFKEDEHEEGAPMDLFPGLAKRMAEKQIEAYNIQYGMSNFAIVRPGNVYGPGDNFDPNSAMVVPSLMARIANKENPVVIWGDGSAIRDFSYSRDIAVGIIRALHFGTKASFINLGSGTGISIRELVATLKQVVDFDYEFDISKPSGFPRRILDISRARNWIGYNPCVSLEDGLRQTWQWFIEHRKEYLQRKNYFN